MSTALTDPAIRDAYVPISVEQYRRMGDAGIISEKTELIRGVIIRKMNKSPLHRWTVTKLLEMINRSLPANTFVQAEQPLSLSDSELEPDISVVAGGLDDFRDAHPKAALLVIEVAISTEAIDRAKAEVYAHADIPEYWLVLPEQNRMVQFTRPSDGRYHSSETLGFDTTVRLKPPLGFEIDLRKIA